MPFSRQTRGRIAWLKSFFKGRHTFNDYPVDYIDQGEASSFPSSRFTHCRWRVDLIGSHITGLGDSREEALADAHQKFTIYEAGGGKMSRPGGSPKIGIASDEIVSSFPELKEHFIANVLELPWAIITDESSLWDFHVELDNSAFFEKIWHVYGFDASYIDDGNLARIFTDMRAEMREFPEDKINKSIRMGRAERDRRAAALPVPPWIQREDDEDFEAMVRRHDSNP